MNPKLLASLAAVLLCGCVADWRYSSANEWIGSVPVIRCDDWR
jgi:hypothetical protein